MKAHALPILNEWKTWLDVESPKLLPKSPVAQGAAYALNQWSALARYCDDGDLSIDNNATEQAMKGPALGRKNWLLVGSPIAGQRVAVLMSLVESCKRNQVEPYAYLKHLFETLPRLGENPPPEQLTPLLPNRRLAANPTHRWEIDVLKKHERNRRR